MHGFIFHRATSIEQGRARERRRGCGGAGLLERWNAMAPVLWVLALLSTITVIHRIAYTYQQTKDMRVAQGAPIG